MSSGAPRQAFDRLPDVPPPKANPPTALNTVIKSVLLIILLGFLGLFFYRHSSALAGTDFPDFYCASRMVMEGHGHELYNAEAQRQFQNVCAARVGTLYIHPPFEAAFLAAIAWLPLHNAYLVWCLINLGFLVLAAWKMATDILPGLDWRLLFAALLTFVPVLLNFLQGQDSVFLLLLVVLGFSTFRGGHKFIAGCWLGLGLFKFHLIVPLALILAIQRGGGRFARGFALVALALGGLSMIVSGWQVFVCYPKFLLDLQQQPFSGVFPNAMANFHGLVQLLFPRDHSALAVVIVATLSGATLLTTLAGWKNACSASLPGQADDFSQFNLAFGNTLVFTMLVGYHLGPHDLSILLLPMALVSRVLTDKAGEVTSSTRPFVACLLAILFLPPLHLLALQAHAYALLAVPVGALYFLIAWVQRRGRISCGLSMLGLFRL